MSTSEGGRVSKISLQITPLSDDTFGTSGLSTPSTRQRRIRKYNDDYLLVNSTFIYDFHDRGFILHQTASKRYAR